VIARTWRGWTSADDADRYAVFYPQGDDFLVEREWTCLHYEVPVASR